MGRGNAGGCQRQRRHRRWRSGRRDATPGTFRHKERPGRANGTGRVGRGLLWRVVSRPTAILDALGLANKFSAQQMDGAPHFDLSVVGVRKKVRSAQGLIIPARTTTPDPRPDWVIVPALSTGTPELLRRQSAVGAGCYAPRRTPVNWIRPVCISVRSALYDVGWKYEPSGR